VLPDDDRAERRHDGLRLHAAQVDGVDDGGKLLQLLADVGRRPRLGEHDRAEALAVELDGDGRRLGRRAGCGVAAPLEHRGPQRVHERAVVDDDHPAMVAGRVVARPGEREVDQLRRFVAREQRRARLLLHLRPRLLALRRRELLAVYRLSGEAVRALRAGLAAARVDLAVAAGFAPSTDLAAFARRLDDVALHLRALRRREREHVVVDGVVGHPREAERERRRVVTGGGDGNAQRDVGDAVDRGLDLTEGRVGRGRGHGQDVGVAPGDDRRPRDRDGHVSRRALEQRTDALGSDGRRRRAGVGLVRMAPVTGVGRRGAVQLVQVRRVVGERVGPYGAGRAVSHDHAVAARALRLEAQLAVLRPEAPRAAGEERRPGRQAGLVRRRRQGAEELVGPLDVAADRLRRPRRIAHSGDELGRRHAGQRTPLVGAGHGDEDTAERGQRRDGQDDQEEFAAHEIAPLCVRALLTLCRMRGQIEPAPTQCRAAVARPQARRRAAAGASHDDGPAAGPPGPLRAASAHTWSTRRRTRPTSRRARPGWRHAARPA